MILLACFRGADASVAVEDEEVVFRLTAPQAESVFLVGDFNGWNPTIDKMIQIDGQFEIRLYLLPGPYRYRFIVEGESISDPDNGLVDADGNSFFFLAETADGFAILSQDAVGAEGAVRERLDPYGTLHAVTGSYRDAAFVVAGVEGSGPDESNASLAVGYELTSEHDDVLRGEAFFVRGRGTYRFSRGELIAFTRDADLDFADPAALFGDAGLYRYPLGVFCRGLAYEGRLPLGLEGKLFFANRLHGYIGDAGEGASDESLFAEEDRTDSDLVGIKVASKLWKTRFAYLMRSDKRPRSAAWVIPGSAGEVYEGFEKVRIDGLWLSLSGNQPVTVEAEILSGTRYLCSTGRLLPGEECCSDAYESQREWERGIRFYAGLRYRGERRGFLVAIDRVALDGEKVLREGRPPGERVSVLAAADIVTRLAYLGARLRMEHYSAGNTGEVFWSKSRNFFLDGDDLSVGRLPFTGARDLYEVELVFMQPEGLKPDSRKILSPLPGIEHGTDGSCGEPFPLTISLLVRGYEGSHVSEMRFSKGLGLLERIRLLLDMRYVSYRIEGWTGEKDFLDIYTALGARITGDSWVSIGLGVNPFYYDRRLLAYSALGREHYLGEQGILGALGGDRDAVKVLEAAERSLAEEWTITFEAFVRFW